MKDLKKFNIQFVGLKDGFHDYEYHIDHKFFEAFEFDEFHHSSLDVLVKLNKKPNLMELDFFTNGTINVPCDLTGEQFDLEVSGSFPLIVKFGDVYNDEHEDILILPHEAYEMNVAQYIYELIVLSVPSKRVHPGVQDGTLKSDVLEKLKEIEYKEEDTVEDKTEAVDPRWDKLKDLLTGKNE